MSVHIHSARNWCASALILVPAPFLLGWTYAPASQASDRAQVNGVVTCSGRPFVGTIYFLPEDERLPAAMGLVNPDGSFELYVNGRKDQPGAVPATYRIILDRRTRAMSGSRQNGGFLDPRTSDLVAHIGSGWNHVRLDLR